MSTEQGYNEPDAMQNPYEKIDSSSISDEEKRSEITNSAVDIESQRGSTANESAALNDAIDENRAERKKRMYYGLTLLAVLTLLAIIFGAVIASQPSSDDGAEATALIAKQESAPEDTSLDVLTTPPSNNTTSDPASESVQESIPPLLDETQPVPPLATDVSTSPTSSPTSHPTNQPTISPTPAPVDTASPPPTASPDDQYSYNDDFFDNFFYPDDTVYYGLPTSGCGGGFVATFCCVFWCP